MKYLPFIFENQDVKSIVANSEVVLEVASKQIINMNIILEDYIYNNLHQFINYGNDLTDIYENIKNFVVNANVNNYLLFSEVLASTQLSNNDKLTWLYEVMPHIDAHSLSPHIQFHPNSYAPLTDFKYTGNMHGVPVHSPSNGWNRLVADGAKLKQSGKVPKSTSSKVEDPVTTPKSETSTPKTEVTKAEEPASTPKTEVTKPKGKLRGALIKTGLVGGGVTGAVGLTRAAYNVGLEHPKNDQVSASNSSAPAAATNKTSAPATSADAPKVYKHNPWATDSNGHVSGTKYSPDQYKQHLVNKYGVERANAAIARASGPGWTPQSLNK